jgi:hypothetical protein
MKRKCENFKREIITIHFGTLVSYRSPKDNKVFSGTCFLLILREEA